MRIRMKVTKFATPNGGTEEYLEGKVYTMLEAREVLVARGFITQKWAVELEEDAKPAPEKKPQAPPVEKPKP